MSCHDRSWSHGCFKHGLPKPFPSRARKRVVAAAILMGSFILLPTGTLILQEGV
ncbi:MAG TPA: hypothetical protein VE981_05670 [Planctomycetota bacterium]|nr:hypothetical protein [Planctomycetota bacterium]